MAKSCIDFCYINVIFPVSARSQSWPPGSTNTAEGFGDAHVSEWPRAHHPLISQPAGFANCQQSRHNTIQLKEVVSSLWFLALTRSLEGLPEPKPINSGCESVSRSLRVTTWINWHKGIQHCLRQLTLSWWDVTQYTFTKANTSLH